MNMTISNNAQRPVAMPVAATSVTTAISSEKTDASAVADKVTLGEQATESATYTDPRANVTKARPDVASMLEESNRKVQEIINLILPLIEQQGLNLAKLISGEQKLTADAATIAQARAAIAEDGELGVRQVAERILNFAQGAIGGDTCCG